jgi:hypothetical protein
MGYLFVCNFGCLIQSLDCLQLLSAIHCLECASMTYLLFISRTTQADSGTQGSGLLKWESEPILASLSASSLPLMSQWPGTQNNLTLLLEHKNLLIKDLKFFSSGLDNLQVCMRHIFTFFVWTDYKRICISINLRPYGACYQAQYNNTILRLLRRVVSSQY